MYKTAKNSITNNDTHCLVCGAKTSGMHFQVNCCRACATFFRRSVKAKKVYRCRRGSRTCELVKNNKEMPMCRFCRLQRCYNVGMRYEKIETDNGNSSSDDAASRMVPTSSTDSPPQQVSTSSPELQVAPMSNGSENGAKQPKYSRQRLIPLVDEVKNILNQPFPPPMYNLPKGVFMTPFQQLQYAFARFLEIVRPNPNDVKLLEVADKLASIRFQEQYVLKFAELVMCCEPFANLQFEDKWNLFRHFWCAFYTMERLYSSLEVFGYDANTFLIDMQFAADINTKWYISSLSTDKSLEYNTFCQSMKCRWLESFAIPFKTMAITRFEIVYILMQMMWSVNLVSVISEEGIAVGNRILEQISSELHNFYVYDMQLTNYAARHAQIMRLITTAEHYTHQYKDYMIMARIFNIFENELYISELIE